MEAQGYRKVGRPSAPVQEPTGADSKNPDFIARRSSPEFAVNRILTALSTLRWPWVEAFGVNSLPSKSVRYEAIHTRGGQHDEEDHREEGGRGGVQCAQRRQDIQEIENGSRERPFTDACSQKASKEEIGGNSAPTTVGALQCQPARRPSAFSSLCGDG